MSPMDYLINAGSCSWSSSRRRERRLDRRALVVPLVLVYFVARQNLRSIPVSGNDLVLIGLLASAGVSLGLLSGFATQVRAGAKGFRAGPRRMDRGRAPGGGDLFEDGVAFVVTRGAGQAIRSFSIGHQISADAWPVATVSMAICEVTVGVVTVYMRGRRLQAATAPAAIGVGVAA